MKNLFLVLLVLITSNIYGQYDFSHDKPKKDVIGTTQGFDLPNIFRGGKELPNGEKRNGNAIDYRGRAFITFTNNLEVGLFVELFPTIDYYANGMDVSYVIDLKGRWSTSIGAELMYVQRPGLEPDSDIDSFTLTRWPYLNWGLNLRVRYDLSDKWFLESQKNLNHRNDIIGLWGRGALPSGTFPALWEGRSWYLSIGYKFN